MSLQTNLSDQELVVLLQRGDAAAFTMVFHRYYGLLFIHAYKKLRDAEQAKDVVQELFTALWVRRERLSLTNDNLAVYLYTAVRNRILDVIARQQVREKYIQSLQGFIDREQTGTDYRVRSLDLAALIEAEISALPPKMREVFEMSRYENLSHKEIAEKLELSELTVRTHVKKALRILRMRLNIGVYFLALIGYFF
ncbi:RNA polymerase sigma-70 factor [Parapedobacter lycopersici]|uniref:RNA polymerase sigma-70 factor n=1 Tax=Parapedobacter lycopersici TaxID=1864939 RepID=UPI00214D4DEE|nr:RNA polymerase sigma-70 factor [Parapedobacter lycopersici]